MSLAERLKTEIKTDRPVLLDRFLNIVISTTKDSYYAEADRFGENGDFITAPEISQLFGEILAAFQAWLWEMSGSPDADEMMIFEAGPGRGNPV